MLKKILCAAVLLSSLAAAATAQNTNTGTTTPAPATRGKRVTTTATPQSSPAREQDKTSTPAPTETGAKRAAAAATKSPQAVEAERGVRDAFDTLVDGIRRADVDVVMGVYWNSPQLLLFNNNGTVTRGWEQVRANRASSYPNLSDVKLDVRDVRVQLLSTQSALVTCLWSQSQTVRDRPDTASGRLTLVFQKLGGAWKIMHTHTSPDAPDPSRVPASERATPDEETPPPATKPPTKP